MTSRDGIKEMCLYQLYFSRGEQYAVHMYTGNRVSYLRDWHIVHKTGIFFFHLCIQGETNLREESFYLCGCLEWVRDAVGGETQLSWVVQTICDACLSELGLDRGKSHPATTEFSAHVQKNVNPNSSEFEFALISGYLLYLILVQVVVQLHYYGLGQSPSLGVRDLWAWSSTRGLPHCPEPR